MSDMFLKGMIGFCFAFLLLIGVSALMERYAPERIWDKLFLPFQSRKKEEREKKKKKAQEKSKRKRIRKKKKRKKRIKKKKKKMIMKGKNHKVLEHSIEFRVEKEEK